MWYFQSHKSSIGNSLQTRERAARKTREKRKRQKNLKNLVCGQACRAVYINNARQDGRFHSTRTAKRRRHAGHRERVGGRRHMEEDPEEHFYEVVQRAFEMREQAHRFTWHRFVRRSEADRPVGGSEPEEVRKVQQEAQLQADEDGERDGCAGFHWKWKNQAGQHWWVVLLRHNYLLLKYLSLRLIYYQLIKFLKGSEIRIKCYWNLMVFVTNILW